MHPLFTPSSVALHAVFFFLTAFFVSKLASRLRYDERPLESGANYWVLENVPIKVAWFQDSFSAGSDRSGVSFQAAVGF